MPGESKLPAAAWVQRSIVQGSSLGLLETAFVYATGFAPLFDFVLIWACNLLLCITWGYGLTAVVRVVGKVRGRVFPAHGRLRDLGLLLFPALLFALRGNVDPHQVNHPWGSPARWGVTLAVILVVMADALVDREHLNEPMSLRRFALTSWLSSFVVVAGFASRTIDFTAAGDIIATDPARVWIALLALLLPMCLLWMGTRSFPELIRSGRELSWALGLCAISGFLALLLRAGEPRLEIAPRRQDAQPEKPRPSVLLVVLDTVRQDHVSGYGYQRRTTPNLDAFAESATLFKGARAASTYSLSTHASLFTGLPPHLHGAHPIPPDAAPDATLNPGHYRLRASVDTLADELKAAGYVTAGISGNDMFLARWTGLQRGFLDFACEARRSYRFVPTVAPLLSRLGPAVRRAFPDHDEWPAETITKSTLAWTARIDRRPFFLFVNYFDAHAPYYPRSPYDRLFPPPSTDQNDVWISRYDGEIAYVDASLKALFEGLRDQGLFDDMLIIVTADHGEFFGEHGLHGHADLLYEPVLRVPLIVKLPRQRQGLRSPARIGQWQVRELVQRVLSGGTTPERLAADLDPPGPRALAESWSPGPSAAAVALPISTPRARAIYLGPFKLVERTGAPDWLFHLPSDPSEEHDLFAREPELVRALQVRARQAVGRLNEATEDPEVPVVDEGVLEKLRSLGYLGVPPGRRGTPQR